MLARPVALVVVFAALGVALAALAAACHSAPTPAPAPDRDGDGIPDAVDQCPFEPEVYDDWFDEDGCPDCCIDLDDDGVTRKADLCPDVPGVAPDGCAAWPALRIVAFAAGESAPGADDARALAAIGQELARRGGQLRVMAFGTADEPEALADARLDAVADAIQAGVPAPPAASDWYHAWTTRMGVGRPGPLPPRRVEIWPPAAWRAADAPP